MDMLIAGNRQHQISSAVLRSNVWQVLRTGVERVNSAIDNIEGKLCAFGSLHNALTTNKALLKANVSQ